MNKNVNNGHLYKIGTWRTPSPNEKQPKAEFSSK